MVPLLTRQCLVSRPSSGSAAGALFVVMVTASVIGAPAHAAWARLFFVIVLLGGLIATARLVGPGAQVALALALVVLVVAQRAIARPVAVPPSSQWTAPLAGPDQMVRHVVNLPVDRPEWSALWQRAAGAAVYVCARGPLAEEDELRLYVNDEFLVTITQALAFGPRPQPTSIGFYRVPLSRSLLERQNPATFLLRRGPSPSGSPSPAAASAGAIHSPIEICGTFSYRPTAGLESSAFFDGVAWSSPGTTQRGRYLIELRLEDREMGALQAWY